MYRILFLNFNPRSRKYIHFGFEEAGCTVLEYVNEYVNQSFSLLEQKICSLIDSFKPDILFSYGWWMDLQNIGLLQELLKSKGIFHIYWATDDPPCFEIMSLPIALKVDLVFTTAVECIEKYKAYGIKAYYLLFGCYPPIHMPMGDVEEYKTDVVLLGHNYNVKWDPNYFSYRMEGIKNILQPLVEKQYHLKVWGLWWDAPDRIFNLPAENYGSLLPYSDVPKVYSSSKIVLGLQTVGDSKSTLSSRTFEVLSCGAFHLSQYSPALETYFKKGIHLEWSESPSETLELVDFYLKNEASRKKIAQKGHELVLAKHTFTHRAASALNIIRRYIS